MAATLTLTVNGQSVSRSSAMTAQEAQDIVHDLVAHQTSVTEADAMTNAELGEWLLRWIWREIRGGVRNHRRGLAANIAADGVPVVPGVDAET